MVAIGMLAGCGGSGDPAPSAAAKASDTVKTNAKVGEARSRSDRPSQSDSHSPPVDNLVGAGRGGAAKQGGYPASGPAPSNGPSAGKLHKIKRCVDRADGDSSKLLDCVHRNSAGADGR